MLPFKCDNDDIISATLNQDNIGWYPFLLGDLSHYWQAIQHDYFVSLSLRNTGAKWTAQLIIKLFCSMPLVRPCKVKINW
jgi:hypothetical protein